MVVWSDGTTSFAGAISTQGLHGGFIETSGHVFNFTGGSVNAGRGGAWLLDPVDLTIDATLAGTIATALDAGSDVTQQTTATGSGGNGDITVASGISWSSDATLTLSAYRHIAVNATIASTGGGGVVLRADNAGTGTGTVTFGGGQVSTAGTVSIYYNPIGDSSTVNATKYTAATQTSFAGNVTGGATLKTHMLVNNVFDLQNMKNSLTGTYALGRDIDASITSGWNSGAGFESIGAGISFNGNLDGLGHAISGLFINRITQNVGLISYLGAGATVSNLSVIDATVTGHTAVGAIVGQNYGAVTNVYSSGSVTATSAGAGGLVGYNLQTVSNGYSNSIVSGPLYVGGAVGLNNLTNAAGGGYTAGSLSQIYATGAVTGTGGSPSAIGGLVGFNGNSITQSYWDSYTTGRVSGVGSGGSAGVTAVTSDPAQSAAANYAFKQSAYSGFSFPGTGTTGWFMVDGQTRPFGRWEYQTTITNAHQLQLMAMDLSASYRLTSNIDFSSGLAVGGKFPGMWSASGFSPIGDVSTAFTGSFDGQGRTISNLVINRPSDAYIGLFGTIGIGGSASNLSLQNANVTGLAYVGGLTGFNDGSISNVSVSGAIAGSFRIGGLVGQNNTGRSISNASASGTVTASGSGYAGGLVGVSSGSISGSFATVAVSGNGASTAPFGGLVGWNNGSSSIIQNSYATGTVSSGTGSTRTGGLVGQNNGKVFDSYATGNVSGGTQGSGGLVGYNAIGATIARTYAAGTVNASALVGGLVGSNDGSVAQSYWDTTTSGRSVGIGAGSTTGAAGLTTSQMQDPANFASTYAGWDFATVWSAPSAGYYPQLYGVNYVLRIDPANASRVYGDANPAFTYTSYGLHTGDTSAILAGLSLSTAATTTSNVGSYAITVGGSVTSTGGQAYRLIQTPAALTVTQRAITVTADAKSRAYGDANPALTYQVGGAGSGQRRQSFGCTGHVGDDDEQCRHLRHQPGHAHRISNYALSYTGANLTVDAARDHGDGRCQEPRLWRRQPGADLSGRRRRAGQRRHAVGRAGDIGDDDEQCRHRTPSRRARSPASIELHADLCGANLTVTPAARSR